MTGIELRAPRREVRRDRDMFLPILALVGAIACAAWLLARRAHLDEPADRVPANKVHLAEPPPVLTEQQRTPSESPKAISPVNKVTTESGRVFYVPTSPRHEDAQSSPTAADYYQRAIEIMESGRPKMSVRTAPAEDDVLRIANEACYAFHAQGTIAYRNCRAEQWHRLRDGCISRRGQLHMTSGSAFYTARDEVDEWCTAESQYKIVD